MYVLVYATRIKVDRKFARGEQKLFLEILVRFKEINTF